MKAPAVFLFSLLLLCPAPHASALAGPQPKPFFFMGDGHLHIQSEKNGEKADVLLLTPEGRFNEKALAAVDRVFGFPTDDKGEHISPRLIFMLDYFSDLAAPNRVIHLESGYRSPEYNTALRNKGGIVAKTSLHMDGMALDFWIDGVDGKKLWNRIREKDCGGVGYYGDPSIHLDSGRPRFWESDTAKTTTGESDYNRKIYLSTDLDRYRHGEKIRLSLSSVSNFGFGILPAVTFLDETSQPVAASKMDAADETECIPVPDRKASRFLYVTVPADIPAGACQVQIEFCNRPFPQMPVKCVSNKIEIW